MSLPLRLMLLCARFSLLTLLLANPLLDGDLYFKMLLHSKADKSASNSSCCFLSPVVHQWRGGGGASHHVLRLFLVALQFSSRSLALCAAFCTDDCFTFIHAVFWAMLYCGLCATFHAPQWLGLSGFWRCFFGQCALSRMNLGPLPRAVRLRRFIYWMLRCRSHHAHSQ